MIRVTEKGRGFQVIKLEAHQLPLATDLIDLSKTCSRPLFFRGMDLEHSPHPVVHPVPWSDLCPRRSSGECHCGSFGDAWLQQLTAIPEYMWG